MRNQRPPFPPSAAPYNAITICVRAIIPICTKNSYIHIYEMEKKKTKRCTRECLKPGWRPRSSHIDFSLVVFFSPFIRSLCFARARVSGIKCTLSFLCLRCGAWRRRFFFLVYYAPCMTIAADHRTAHTCRFVFLLCVATAAAA